MTIETHLEQIWRDTLAELEHANTKFPDTTNSTVALTEEVGEFAKALLHLTEKADGSLSIQSGLRQDIYEEGIQVIAMTLKILTRGDPSLKYKGIYCSYAGCRQAQVGGPCPLCYE